MEKNIKNFTSVKITADKQKSKLKTTSKLIMKVLDLKGKEIKEITLKKEIFASPVNERLIAQYVRVYLANQRQGTASTKMRGEVVGSTRKIYRQKGTGKARHGDIRAPIFVGGGVTFGPKPRDYSLKMNKKQQRKALFDSLTLKYKNNQIEGLEDGFLKIEPKTKVLYLFLKQTNNNKRKTLLVLPKIEKNNLILASRNIPNLAIVAADSINAYNVLNSEKIFFVEKALELFVNHFFKKNEN
jgi:large subunit ribosomal protein L4